MKKIVLPLLIALGLVGWFSFTEGDGVYQEYSKFKERKSYESVMTKTTPFFSDKTEKELIDRYNKGDDASKKVVGNVLSSMEFYKAIFKRDAEENLSSVWIERYRVEPTQDESLELKRVLASVDKFEVEPQSGLFSYINMIQKGVIPNSTPPPGLLSDKYFAIEDVKVEYWLKLRKKFIFSIEANELTTERGKAVCLALNNVHNDDSWVKLPLKSYFDFDKKVTVVVKLDGDFYEPINYKNEYCAKTIDAVGFISQ